MRSLNSIYLQHCNLEIAKLKSKIKYCRIWKEKEINMFKVPALFIPKLIVDYLIVVGLNAVACRRCRFLGILFQMIITPGQGCQ